MAAPVAEPASVAAPVAEPASVESKEDESTVASIEELGGEELFIPNGMVLPMDDDEIDTEPREVPLPMTEIGKLSLDRTGSKLNTLQEEETRQEDEALLQDVDATIAVNRMIEEVGGEAEAIKIIEEFNASSEEEKKSDNEPVSMEEATAPVIPAPIKMESALAESVASITPVSTPSEAVDENGEVYQFYRPAIEPSNVSEAVDELDSELLTVTPEFATPAPTAPVSEAPEPAPTAPVSEAPAPAPTAPVSEAPAPAPTAPVPAAPAPVTPSLTAPAVSTDFDFDLPLIDGDEFDI